jgi:hypothetical protein
MKNLKTLRMNIFITLHTKKFSRFSFFSYTTNDAISLFPFIDLVLI